MEDGRKRKAPAEEHSAADNKKPKNKKSWFARQRPWAQAVTIEPGDAGIWATCDKGKEPRCVGELRDLFEEHARSTQVSSTGRGDDDSDDAEEVDIEAEVSEEVKTLLEPKKDALFTHVRLDVQCVMFFKTRPPVEPVAFVHSICTEAAASNKKRTRLVKRLTPMTAMAKATEAGLADLCKTVLALHFHQADGPSRKFAIRPSFRNHNKPLSRDLVIKQVAAAVGLDHKVDLSNPELTIIVEVYQNVCGMSVVGSDFERLKRYNLAEIYQPESNE